MPQSKRGRVLFALFTCLAVILIGMNLYRHMLTAACMAAVQANDWPKVHRLLQQGALIGARDADLDSVLTWASSDGGTQDIELLLQRGAHANASTSLGRPLDNAVKAGNTRVVRVLLSHHANPDAPDDFGRSALGLAVLNPTQPEIIQILRDTGAHLTLFETVEVGDLAVVNAYLAQGSSPEQTNHNGQTLLALAAQNGRSDVVQALLAAGANVNGYSSYINGGVAGGSLTPGQGFPLAETALFAAARKGDPETIRLLLKAGADVNIRLKDTTAKSGQASSADANLTPLICAAQAGKLEAVRLLLAHGADPKLGTAIGTGLNGETALSSAILSLPASPVPGMVAVSKTNKRGRNSLLQSVIFSLDVSTNEMMQSTSPSAGTPDDLARRRERQNRTEIVRLLIEAGAEVNALSTDHLSPLSRACFYGYEEIAALLLEHGADVNICRHEENALLLTLIPRSLTGMSRSSYPNRTVLTRIVRLLLAKHADVNVTLTGGVTALMLAVGQGDIEIAQMLLAHNADIHAVTQDGRTVLGFAYSPLAVHEGVDSSAEKSRMIALIRSHGVHPTLQEAAHFGEVPDLKTYLAQGADANTTGPKGVPLLLDAAASGKTEAVTLLLDHRAKVDSTDTNGWTALMVAAANGNTEIVRLLIQHHADITHKNKTGKTALDEAERQSRTDLTALLTPQFTEVPQSH